MCSADRVDVALLVDRLRRDACRLRWRQTTSSSTCGGRLALVEHARHGLDRRRADVVAALDQPRELAHHRRGRLHRLGVAVERDDVAAQADLGREMLLERLEDRVLGAGQLGRHLVRELQLPSCHLGQGFLHLGRHRPPVGAAVRSGEHVLDHPAHVPRALRAGRLHALADERVELGVGQLGRQVGVDRRRPRPPPARARSSRPAVAVGPLGLPAPLALAPQDRQLVAARRPSPPSAAPRARAAAPLTRSRSPAFRRRSTSALMRSAICTCLRVYGAGGGAGSDGGPRVPLASDPRPSPRRRAVPAARRAAGPTRSPDGLRVAEARGPRRPPARPRRARRARRPTTPCTSRAVAACTPSGCASRST